MVCLCVGASSGLAAQTDWTSYRRDHNNSGATSGTTAFNGKLILVWRYRADSRITSTPVVHGDLVYAGTWNGDVLALDLATGRVHWRAHLGANPDEAYGGPRGVIGSMAFDGDVVFATSGNCIAAALSADTGRFVWRTPICDIKRSDDVYASPVIAGKLVLIGVDIMEDRPTDQGREIALDAATGKVRWQYWPAKYKGTGTGVSATAALDDSARVAYIGTGNPTPVTNPPPGDDPGSDSIIALEVASGKPMWTYGPSHPHDTQDDDFFGSPNRFHTSGGWRIGEGSKDGSYYVLDAADGKKLWVKSLGSVTSSMIVGTAALGQDTIYVSVFTTPTSGSINAIRASDGRVMWSSATGGEYEAPLVLGNTVFTTESTGWLNAFRAGSGARAGRWKLCGKATGRGPSAAADRVFVAAGNCLDAYALH
jgi:outer membrane protein assembly factor BamB